MGAGQVTWYGQDRVFTPCQFHQRFADLLSEAGRGAGIPSDLLGLVSSVLQCTRYWSQLRLSCPPPLLTQLTCGVCSPPAWPTAGEAHSSAETTVVLQNLDYACLGKGISENGKAQERCWTLLPLFPSPNQESFAPASHKQHHCLSDSASSCFLSELVMEATLRLKLATAAHRCDCSLVSMPYMLLQLAIHYIHKRKKKVAVADPQPGCSSSSLPYSAWQNNTCIHQGHFGQEFVVDGRG